MPQTTPQPQQYRGYVVGSKPNPNDPSETLWTVKDQTGTSPGINGKFTIEKNNVPSGIATGLDVSFNLTPAGNGKTYHLAVNVQLALV